VDAVDLAGLEHENMIVAFGTAAGQIPGARTSRAEGVALIASGHPMRLFNQVIIDGSPDDEAVASAVRVMRERGHNFVVSLRRGADDAFLLLMGRLGLIPMSDGAWMPGMALYPLAPIATESSAGLEIRRVLDRDGVTDHVLAGAGGFGIPVSWMEAIVTEALLDLPGASLYVAIRMDCRSRAASGSGPAERSASTTSRPSSQPVVAVSGRR
jgi:hypothetical protein